MIVVLKNFDKEDVAVNPVDIVRMETIRYYGEGDLHEPNTPATAITFRDCTELRVLGSVQEIADKMNS